MAENTLGQLLRITSFGESHGPGIGVVVDGFPAGFALDFEAIRAQMLRRRPGQSQLTTARSEADEVQFLSGIFDGKTTGAPIALFIPSADARPADYDALKDTYRPSHADFTYQQKYGIRDHRGGGRTSARITAAWVAAGALAEQFLLHHLQLQVLAWVQSVYTHEATDLPATISKALIDASPVRCPDPRVSALIEAEILTAKHAGDSLGGTITCLIRNCPAGIGEPVFGKLNARLAHAICSINAVKGIEFGDGFNITKLRGSEANDAFQVSHGSIGTLSNHSGGIQGGISNGQDITFTAAFKPTATIAIQQQTVNQAGEQVTLEAKGRHDPCVLARAVPIVEALTALTLLDLWLQHRATTFS